MCSPASINSNGSSLSFQPGEAGKSFVIRPMSSSAVITMSPTQSGLPTDHPLACGRPRLFIKPLQDLSAPVPQIATNSVDGKRVALTPAALFVQPSEGNA